MNNQTNQSNQTNKQNQGWDDKSAQWYIDRFSDEPIHKIVPTLCQLQDGEIVLDLGCGSGSVLEVLAQQLSTGKVIGVDPTPKMIEMAKVRLAKETFRIPIELHKVGTECLPFLNESIDVAVAVNTLHHWTNVDTGLKEVMRVLKPHGRLIIIDELWEEIEEEMKLIIAEHEEYFAHSTHLSEFKTTEGILEALSNAGFLNLARGEHRQAKIAVSVVTGYKSTNMRAL